MASFIINRLESSSQQRERARDSSFVILSSRSPKKWDLARADSIITTFTWTKKNDPSMQKAMPMNSSDSIRSFRLPNLSTTRTEMEVPVTWITPTTMAQMLASNWNHCWD